MNEDRFRYVEQDPPLTGKERRADYSRQYMRWRYATNPDFRAGQKLTAKTQRDAGYFRDYAARKRARMLAVAREYGATLAIAVGLMLPAVAQADPTTVNIPVQCGPLVELEALIVRHGEKLLLAGTDGDLGTLFFWTNFETGTWTVVRKIDDESGCIMMSGGALQPIPQSIIPLPGEPV